MLISNIKAVTKQQQRRLNTATTAIATTKATTSLGQLNFIHDDWFGTSAPLCHTE